MTTDKPIGTWQEWLETADELLSFEMWERIDQTLKSTQMPPEDKIPLQTSGVILAYTYSMYLACVKESEPDKALQTIRESMATFRPETPNRKVKASVRKAYANDTKNWTPILAAGGGLLYAAFTSYREDDYDPQADPNLLIREALQMLDEGMEDKALHAIGQALAIAMRSGSIWSGWQTEGNELSVLWLFVISLILRAFPLIPLGSLAEERLHIDERLAVLQPDMNLTSPEEELTDTLNLLESSSDGEADQMDEDEFTQQWTALSLRQDPLTDIEIEEMGGRYQQCVDQAIEILSVIALAQEWEEAEAQNVRVFIHGLGVLRYHEDAAAANALVDILPIVGESPEILDEITWALEQMGTVSTRVLMDTIRYTLDSEKLDITSETLARVGRGDEEVHQFLVERYKATLDEDEKLSLIAALGQLHDQRLLPLLVQALRDSAGDEEGAAVVLGALMEMGAPMTVNTEAGSVTITGFGELKNIVPDWWTPEGADEGEKGDGAYGDEFDSIDLDDLFPGDDDEDEDGDKLYVDDDEESPNPPVNAAGFGPVHVEHIGRNDLCPCGSGKKYKHCHGKNV